MKKVQLVIEFSDGTRQSVLVKTRKEAEELLSYLCAGHTIRGKDFVIRSEWVRATYVSEDE
jgi:hypothetical protein